MNLQKSIMLEYLKIKNNPTLRKMNEDTGIQITRIFRLMNGSKMRLDEYEVFLGRVLSFHGIDKGLLDLVKDSATKLSVESQKEICRSIERKMELVKFKELI